MRAPDFALREAQRLLVLRNERDSRVKVEAIEVEGQSDSTDQPTLDHQRSSSRVLASKGSQIDEEGVQEDPCVASRPFLSILGREKMEVEKECRVPSNCLNDQLPFKSYSSARYANSAETMAIQAYESRSLKEIMLEQLQKKTSLGIFGQRRQEVSRLNSTRNVVDNDFSRKVKSLLLSPYDSQQILGGSRLEQASLDFEGREGINETMAGLGMKKTRKVTFYNKRITRTFMREIQADSEENLPHSSHEDLDRIEIARYRFLDPEISDKISELYSKMPSLVKIRKQRAELPHREPMLPNSYKHLKLTRKLLPDLRRRQVLYLE